MGFWERSWGRLRHLDKFDASFFNIPQEQANLMDPRLRLLLELTTETILDAGMYSCNSLCFFLLACIFIPKFKMVLLLCFKDN